MTISLFRTLVHEKSIENVEEVLRSGWLGLGPKTEEFERAFADYIGCKYAVAFNSGTAALHAAVKLAGWKEGSDIVSTPLTFVSTNHVLLYEGLNIIFADIDPQTGSLDLASIRKACREYHPSGLMIVHYGGGVVNLDFIYEIAKEFKLTIIEDCAHACGASFRRERVGARAKLACFSFHAVKNLALGDGGMLTTNDEELAKRAKRIRWLGVDKSTIDRSKESYAWKYHVGEIGQKSYMNDINAALGLGQLPYLDQDNAIRKNIYNTYLSAGIPMIYMPPGSAYHLAVMLAEDRQQKETIINKLVENDIQYGVHYTPNYYYPMYNTVPRINGCKEVEEFYNRCISLPCHLYLREDDLDRIVTTINKEINNDKK